MVLKNPQGKPLMIWGAPGIGKTAIVKAVLAQNTKGRLIDTRPIVTGKQIGRAHV